MLLPAWGLTMPAAAAKPAPTALILSDPAGDHGWLGDAYSRHLAMLLGHFPLDVTRKSIDDYQPGEMHRYAVTCYLGLLYNHPLPQAFREDVLASTRPVCWINANLKQIAWRADGVPNPAFEAKFGFRVLRTFSPANCRITYRGGTLRKDPSDPLLHLVGIRDAALASAPAICTFDGDPGRAPYIVRGANLTFIADNPLALIGDDDRFLAFADILHEVVGQPHHDNLRAFVRIEDVSPVTPPEAIYRLTDLLAAEHIPFALAVVPAYEDPQGRYHDGTPLSLILADRPLLVQALRYAEAHGGRIVQHGYTHQYGKTPNPFSGVTTDDYEFYRVTQDDHGQTVLQGPPSEESEAWVAARVTAGTRILQQAGLTPIAWETPHYLASPLAYRVFARYFPVAVDRGVTYVTDGAGAQHLWELRTPYLIERDLYGQRRIPETLGYVNPTGALTGEITLPAEMVARAAALRTVRDGCASFFFHWHLDPAYLRDIITGLRALGYHFAPLEPAALP